MKFKRACLVEPHRFALFEVEEEPGYGQVLLKIASCGLCNWELNFWHGTLNYQGYPHKLGHEFAGVVAAVGPGCTRLKVGDIYLPTVFKGTGWEFYSAGHSATAGIQ